MSASTSIQLDRTTASAVLPAAACALGMGYFYGYWFSHGLA